MNKITCFYCGTEKQEIIFCIGASSKKDWCMVEGTGKMACPSCYDTAMIEGQQRIEDHIKFHNSRSK